MKETPSQTAPAPEPIANPYLSLAFALAFPGAGHLWLGRRWRAAIFAAIVLVSIAIGLVLEGKLYRVLPNRPLSVLATLASMGMGAPYFVLRFVLGYQGNAAGVGYEYGTAYLLTAGLMNLLLALDAWDISRGRKE